MRTSSLENIRLSVGTAALLGLSPIRQKDPPTTAYLLMESPEGCNASCLFCPQSRHLENPEPARLSRILWPLVPFPQFLAALKKNPQAFRRICVQGVNYAKVYDDLVPIVEAIRSVTSTPISLSIHPLPTAQMEHLHALGVDRIGIALDAATPRLFEAIKGSHGCYSWLNHWQTLDDALTIFGPDHVSTHLIIGLGETEQEAVEFLQAAIPRRITVGLFAFTPISGTPMESVTPPDETTYRRIQLARHLLLRRFNQHGDQSILTALFTFTDHKIKTIQMPQKELEKIVRSGTPFQTSGCPSCNRPYYNERPGGIVYNYPRRLLPSESEQIWRQIMNDITTLP